MSEESNRYISAVIDEGLRVTGVTRGHKVHTDEPEENGGKDSAATPTEMLLSALAGCKLATMRIVANRKGWNTSGMQIHLELRQEEDRTIIDQHITFPEHLSEEQRTRLTAVSHKCPVSKIVSGEVRFNDI